MRDRDFLPGIDRQSVSDRVLSFFRYILSLRPLLVIPFILQIGGAVGLTGWLSLRNGQKAVREVTLHLEVEVSARIEKNLQDYLQAPRIIAEVNTKG